MNLLAYTRRLAEKIAYYDWLAKNNKFDNYSSNPFNHPVNITIIWVDDNEK